MDPSLLQQHLYSLYLRGECCDATVVLCPRHVDVQVKLHKVVLSQASFFATLMSDAWASGDSSSGSAVEFNVDIEGTSFTVDAFAKLIDFLYGVPPALDETLVEPLLAVASYFGVPALCSLVSDFAFSSMSLSNCTRYASLERLEFGEPGRLIAAAAIAFLHRNAVDLGERLSELSVQLQTQVLASPDLYVPSEFHRYQLALKVKRACLARLAAARPAATAPASGPAWPVVNSPAPVAAPAGAGAVQVSWSDVSWSSTEGGDEKGGPGAGGVHAHGQHIDGSRVPGHWRRSSPGPSRPTPPGAALCGSGQRIVAPFPFGGAAPAASSSFSAACSASSVEATAGGCSAASLRCPEMAHGRPLRVDDLPPLGDALASRAHDADVDMSRGDETCMAYNTEARCAAGAGGSSRLEAELDALFAGVFRSLHLVHFTPEQLVEAAADGELEPALVAAAAEDRRAMTAKLEVANARDVRRIDELLLLPPGSLSADELRALSVTWPPYRRGVEIAGLLADDLAPGPGYPTNAASEWWLFAGSLWRLDVKRHWVSAADAAGDDGEGGAEEEGEEMIAVYLRRRGLQVEGAAAAGLLAGAHAGTFVDTRFRTSLTFSIRLCGAPGSPTSICVAGRSTLGKGFGVDEDEPSWGWEYFLRVAALAGRETWTVGGDRLRFAITQEIL